MSNATIISEGTLRTEDLIPAFMSALQDAMDRRAGRPGQDAPARVAQYGRYQDVMGEIERRMERDGYHGTEEADWDMEWLYNALNEYAPEGTYFGANEGDGACFGFWDNEPEIGQGPRLR